MKKVEIKIKLDKCFEDLPIGEYECKLKEITFESGFSTDTVFLHLEEPCKIKTHEEWMKILKGDETK